MGFPTFVIFLIYALLFSFLRFFVILNLIAFSFFMTLTSSLPWQPDSFLLSCFHSLELTAHQISSLESHTQHSLETNSRLSRNYQTLENLIVELIAHTDAQHSLALESHVNFSKIQGVRFLFWISGQPSSIQRFIFSLPCVEDWLSRWHASLDPWEWIWLESHSHSGIEALFTTPERRRLFSSPQYDRVFSCLSEDRDLIDRFPRSSPWNLHSWRLGLERFRSHYPHALPLAQDLNFRHSPLFQFWASRSHDSRYSPSNARSSELPPQALRSWSDRPSSTFWHQGLLAQAFYSQAPLHPPLSPSTSPLLDPNAFAQSSGIASFIQSWNQHLQSPHPTLPEVDLTFMLEFTKAGIPTALALLQQGLSRCRNDQPESSILHRVDDLLKTHYSHRFDHLLHVSLSRIPNSRPWILIALNETQERWTQALKTDRAKKLDEALTFVSEHERELQFWYQDFIHWKTLAPSCNLPDWRDQIFQTFEALLDVQSLPYNSRQRPDWNQWIRALFQIATWHQFLERHHPHLVEQASLIHHPQFSSWMHRLHLLRDFSIATREAQALQRSTGSPTPPPQSSSSDAFSDFRLLGSWEPHYLQFFNLSCFQVSRSSSPIHANPKRL